MDLDEMLGGDDGELDMVVSGLQEVGNISEVGAAAIKALAKGGNAGAIMRKVRMLEAGNLKGALPSPTFGKTAPNTERRSPLGFKDADGNTSFNIAAGDTVTMSAKASRVIHINRLLIQPSAVGLVIDSFKIGDDEQVLSSGAPAELYGPEALTDTIPDNFVPLQSGLEVEVVLRNTSAAAITGTIGCKATCKR